MLVALPSWSCVAGLAAGGRSRVGALRRGRLGTAWYGILQSAGLLFFAFAGYARIATLGEEVRDPARTIPGAITLALGITVAVYAIVAVTVLAPWAGRRRRVRRAARGRGAGAGWAWAVPVVGSARPPRRSARCSP